MRGGNSFHHKRLPLTLTLSLRAGRGKASLATSSAVLDKRAQGRERVVKPARGGVVALGRPVGARCAALIGLRVDGLDQSAAHTVPARGVIDVKILKITVRRRRPCRAMEQRVREPDEPTALVHGNEREEAILLLEEALPGERDDIIRNLRLVEVNVASKQFPPRLRDRRPRVGEW